MAEEVFSLLFQFQADAPELKAGREYDQAAREFGAQLGNVSASQWAKVADAQHDGLSMLDPSVNTMAYAHVLVHRIAALVEKSSVAEMAQPGGTLWGDLVRFLETADPVQLRYVGAEWRKLVGFTEQIARAVDSPAVAVAPIRSAMLRLDPTTGTFTSAHVAFIHLCMETRSYAAAEPILDNYIHSLPLRIPSIAREDLEYSVPCATVASSGEYIHQSSGHSDKISLHEIQEYYVLGAMAYLGLRKFKKAQHFLECVLVAPTANIANGLMLEAYKKWVLVSCLVDGKMTASPRPANSIAIKQAKSASRAYEALAEAYERLDNLSKLKAQVGAGEEIWAEDGNTGLVAELVDSQRRRYVSQLSRTYSAIPISRIASGMGSSQAESASYVKGLIEGGHLNARLEGLVLRFYLEATQGPLALTERQQQQRLLEQTARTTALAEQVRDAEYRLRVSKEYLEHLRRVHKRQGGERMETTWDDGVDAEEDIMTDL